MDPVIVVWFFVPLAFLLLVVVLGFACCTSVTVPSRCVSFVRHFSTQQTRMLGTGLHVVPPWESLVRVGLPRESHMASVPFFPQPTPTLDAQPVYRYDPEPYAALTQDQVPVNVDVWIEYQIVNLQALVDNPHATYKNVLDDEARAATQALVATLPRKALNATALRTKFVEVDWVHRTLKIRHVGVQHIEFDEATRRIQRAESAGLNPMEALDHVRQLDMQDALRTNRNAHVFVGAGGDTQKTMGRVLRTRAATTSSEQ